MLAITHAVIGLLSASLMKKLLFNSMSISSSSSVWHYSLLYYGATVLFSLFPDVDHKGSTINKFFGITKVFPYFFRHRGFFHSIWPAIVLVCIMWNFSSVLSKGILVGYASHLVSDGLTLAGVNFLYPATSFTLRGPVKTGGLGESIVFVISTGLLLYLFLFR